MILRAIEKVVAYEIISVWPPFPNEGFPLVE